jgi:hypothetical protein
MREVNRMKVKEDSECTMGQTRNEIFRVKRQKGTLKGQSVEGAAL